MFKNGLMTSYKSKGDRDNDPLFVKGKAKPNNVKSVNYGRVGGIRLDDKELAEGVFVVTFSDGSSQKFKGVGGGGRSQKDDAIKWVTAAGNSL